MKEKLKELIAVLDSTQPSKMELISKLTGLLAELQKEDVEIPADIFDLFDTNEKRATLLSTFIIMLMNGASIDFQ